MYKIQFFPKYWGFLSRKIYMLFVVIELQLMVPRKYFVIKKNSLKNVLYVGEIYVCKIQYLTILIDKYFTIKYCIFLLFYLF